MSATIRLASDADAAAIQAIYAPYVLETPISFELTPPSVETIAQRLHKTLPSYPWLVCADAAGAVVGYAYAGRFAERAAYDWSAEVSAYVRRDCHRRGVGAALYTSLLALLKLQGYHTAVAIIALPNDASIGLHRSFGFKDAGVLNEVGFKLGSWHDVAYLELALQPQSEPPRLRPLTEVTATREGQAALAAGLPGYVSSRADRPRTML